MIGEEMKISGHSVPQCGHQPSGSLGMRRGALGQHVPQSVAALRDARYESPGVAPLGSSVRRLLWVVLRGVTGIRNSPSLSTDHL